MNRHLIYDVIVLTIVWIILREYFSIFTLVVGIGVSIGCIWFYHKYIPLKEILKANYIKLFVYFLYLLGQVYYAGFFVIKVILTGGKVDIVNVKTKLADETLRVMLADSITLTPGSILLDLKGDTLTLLWLREKSDHRDMSVADDILKGRLEDQLLKVQK